MRRTGTPPSASSSPSCSCSPAPGFAIVELLRVRETLVQLAVVPATSIATGTLVALVLVNADWFTPGRALLCLEVITVGVLLLAIARDARPGRDPGAGLT